MRRALALLVCLVATAAMAATKTDLINREALGTYRRAVLEKNQTKATALLRGLLLANVAIGIDATTVPDGHDDWAEAVREGIGVWSEAIEDSPFELARQGERPSIVVKFVSEIDGDDDLQGLVRAQRHFYWKDGQSGGRVDGVILVRKVSGRRLLTAAEVSRVVTHELGHILGLDDDPDGPGVMADFEPGPGIRSPSNDEVSAIQDFRGMLRAAMRRKTK